MKQVYLDGVKECERMYNAGYTFTELEDHIGTEAKIGGYKWEEWCDGFKSAILHFEKIESAASILS